MPYRSPSGSDEIKARFGKLVRVLKVELPGLGTVHLSGGGTRAALCESLDPSCGRGLGGHASSLLERLERR